MKKRATTNRSEFSKAELTAVLSVFVFLIAILNSGFFNA